MTCSLKSCFSIFKTIGLTGINDKKYYYEYNIVHFSIVLLRSVHENVTVKIFLLNDQY